MNTYETSSRYHSSFLNDEGVCCDRRVGQGNLNHGNRPFPFGSRDDCGGKNPGHRKAAGRYFDPARKFHVLFSAGHKLAS